MDAKALVYVDTSTPFTIATFERIFQKPQPILLIIEVVYNMIKKIIPLEVEEAKVLVRRAQYHPVTRDYLLHIPNGGTRHPIEAKNLRLQGVRAGVSDYLLAYPANGYHGAWIELKRTSKTNPPTVEQLMWIASMRKVGYFAEVAYGADQAWEFFMHYLKPVNKESENQTG